MIGRKALESLFAPTNEAFAALSAGELDTLLADQALLADLLSDHVLPTEANAASVTTGFRTTVQGGPVTVVATGESEEASGSINGYATVVEANLEADNGIVHGVDSVLRIPETEYAAVLSGANQVPLVNTDAQGMLSAVLDDANTTLTVTGTYSGLSGPPTPPAAETSAAHIHVAPRGENGPIVAPLMVMPNADDPTSGTFGGQVPIGTGPGQLPLEALEGFGAYVNIHTEANPGGEIRGQLSDEQAEVPAPTP